MFWKIVRQIVSVIGTAEACWSGYKRLHGVQIVIGAIPIGGLAEWLALSVAGGLTALIAGYQFIKMPVDWIKRQTPKEKFKSFKFEISEHRCNTRECHTRQSELLTERLSLFQKLESLNINTPDLNQGRQWIVFLIFLQPLSETGNKKMRVF